MHKPHLPSKEHEARIQHNGQQKVTRNNGSQGPNGREKLDSPMEWYQLADVPHPSKHYHGCNHEDAENESELEFLQDARHFLEERGVAGLLGSGAP